MTEDTADAGDGGERDAKRDDAGQSPPGPPERAMPDGGQEEVDERGDDVVEALRREEERFETFTSTISHDLRNALNVAVGRTHILRDESDSEHVPPIANALDRMEALIADGVALAREGGRLTETTRVGLKESVNKAWEADDRREATLTIVDDLGAVQSEGSRMDELFEQCFDNAVQHGGDDVAVEVGRLEDGFYVADDGSGLGDEDHEELFTAGFTTEQGSTGFGLAIVRDIAEAHGWSVDLTESDDGGLQVEIRGVEFE